MIEALQIVGVLVAGLTLCALAGIIIGTAIVATNKMLDRL
jgi:hypothetical protein